MRDLLGLELDHLAILYELPDLIPSDQTMLEDLLWAFGVWEDLEEMNAAMQARVYATGPDSKIGFVLVK